MPDPPDKKQALSDALRDADANFGDNQVGQVVDRCPTNIQVDFAPYTPPPNPGVGADPSPFLLRDKGITVVCTFNQAPNQSVGKRVGNNPLLYEAYAPCKPGAVVEIHITLPPFKPGGSPALEMWQAFRIELNNLLTPIGGSDNKTSTKYTRHPRIRALEPRTGNLPRVWVDITFIEATDVVRDAGMLKLYNEAWYSIDYHCAEPTAQGDPNAPPAKTFHHDCELHIYEMTMGKPRAWAIVVPKAARKGGSTCNVLVFFQPTLRNGADYTSAVDCPAYNYDEHLPRYTRDPADVGPFYFQTRGASSQKMLQFYKTGAWTGALPTDAELTEMSMRYWRKPYPHTGFEGQLAASGKPVVLAMPFPHGGNMDYGKATTDGFGYLMSALAKALAADGALSEEKAGIEHMFVDREGVGGFSAGGGAALAAFLKNKETVKELYLFDHFSGLGQATFDPWLKGGDTRLCLVAGQYIKSAIKLNDELRASKSPHVFLTPDSSSFFDTPGNTWAAAIFPPASAGKWESGPQSLDDLGAGGTTSFSATSNVYVTQTTPKLTLGTPGGASHIVSVSRVEAASLVRMWQITNAEHEGSKAQKPTAQAAFSYKRVESRQDLDEVVTADVLYHYGIGENALWDMRHQWAVQGGIGKASRYPYGEQDQNTPSGSAFEGYLHFCLKHSAFS